MNVYVNSIEKDALLTAETDAVFQIQEGWALVKCAVTSIADFDSWADGLKDHATVYQRFFPKLGPGTKLTRQYISLGPLGPYTKIQVVTPAHGVLGEWSTEDCVGMVWRAVSKNRLSLLTIAKVMNHVYYDAATKTKVTQAPSFAVFDAARVSLEYHATHSTENLLKELS